VKISKFNRERNRQFRLNWPCKRLRLPFIFGQFNRLRLLNKLWSITPCLSQTDLFIRIASCHETECWTGSTIASAKLLPPESWQK